MSIFIPGAYHLAESLSWPSGDRLAMMLGQELASIFYCLVATLQNFMHISGRVNDSPAFL